MKSGANCNEEGGKECILMAFFLSVFLFLFPSGHDKEVSAKVKEEEEEERAGGGRGEINDNPLCTKLLTIPHSRGGRYERDQRPGTVATVRLIYILIKTVILRAYNSRGICRPPVFTPSPGAKVITGPDSH